MEKDQETVPNWCYNFIAIGTDDKARLAAVGEKIINAEKQVDFQIIAPMPKLLGHTAHGATEIDGKVHHSWFVEQVDGRAVNRAFTPDEKAELATLGVSRLV